MHRILTVVILVWSGYWAIGLSTERVGAWQGGVTPPSPQVPTGRPTSGSTAQDDRKANESPEASACDYFGQPQRSEWWKFGFGNGRPEIRPDAKNTFVFNHERLRSEFNEHYVLSADHGAYFQVLFKCTAPEFFDYSISGDPAVQPESASANVGPESVVVAHRLTTRGITMRHDERFLKYRVKAKIRAGMVKTPGAASSPPPPPPPQPEAVPPPPPPPTGGVRSQTGDATPPPEEHELFSVEFDLWVVTRPDWKLGIIAGVARSSLVDRKYAIETDSSGAKIFVEDNTQDQFHLDTMALANVYYSRGFLKTLSPGLAFGIGTSGTTTRFFFGPSVVVGRFFVLHGGWALGTVAAPPAGQELGKPPVNGDNTLNSLGSQTISKGYFGIGFTWIDRRDQFAAALSATASASGAVGSCVTSVKPDTVAFDEKGVASGEVTVEAGNDCLWIATLQKGGTAFTVTGGSAKGKGTIKLAAAEATSTARSDVLNVIGPVGSIAKPVKLSQAPKSCVTAVAPKEIDFKGTTTVQTVTLTVEDGCKWSASLEPTGTKFVTKADTEKSTVSVTAPAPAAEEAKATLSITGPPGSAAQKITLTQPATPKK
jgi:hypothetical protein